MAGYRFLTSWLLEAPRSDVWEVIWDVTEWPRWWHGVLDSTELDPGTPCGIGRRGRQRWRGPVPYRLRFEAVATAVEPPRFLEIEASGDLEGTGRWRLYEDDDVTAVLYDWNVRVRRPWMNLTAPLTAPLQRWNHDAVMRAGGVGLARQLGCRLLASD